MVLDLTAGGAPGGGGALDREPRGSGELVEVLDIFYYFNLNLNQLRVFGKLFYYFKFP